MVEDEIIRWNIGSELSGVHRFLGLLSWLSFRKDICGTGLYSFQSSAMWRLKCALAHVHADCLESEHVDDVSL